MSGGPEEASSKQRPPRFQVVVQGPPKAKPRDPRFSSYAGHFNEDLFKKTYSFVDEVREEEITTLSKALKRTKTPEDRERVRTELGILKETQRKEKLREKQRKAAAQRKKAEQQKVAEGKKPFFAKKAEIRKDDLVAKYNELKEGKKLEQYMEKKRKRRAAKDRARMPRQSRREEADE